MAGYPYTAVVYIYRNLSQSDTEYYTQYVSGTSSSPQGSGFSVYVPLSSTESHYSRTGYDFIGYGEAYNSETPSFQPSDTVGFYFPVGGGTAGKNLYCLWALKTYTISFNANGGTGAPSAQTKTYGQDLTLPATTPTRDGFLFQGWSTSATGAVEYQPSGTFSVDADTVLYAIWRTANSTLSSVTSPLEVGATGTATWNIIDTTYTYKLNVTYSNAPTVTVNVAANSASTTFVIPSTWYQYIPNSTSVTANATLITYENGVALGDSSLTFTVSVPSSVKPTISTFAATPYSTNTTVTSWNVFVQGYSKVDLSASATAGTGASIVSYSFSGYGVSQSSTSTTAQSTMLDTTGSMTYTLIVTDSRGRTATSTVQITVLEYSNPSVSSLNSFRCLSDGTQSDTDGTYINSTPVFAFSSVDGHNSLTTAKIEYKTHSGSTWASGASPVTSGTAYTFGGGAVDVSFTYDVRCVITDALGNTSTLSILVPPIVGFSIGLNNDRARFGGVVEKAGLQVDWDAEFNGVVDITNRRSTATLASAGWYRILSTSKGNGSHVFTADITIGQTYSYSNNFVHFVKLVRTNGYAEFMGELSKINTNAVTKIRYNTDGDGNGYVDIYYNSSNSNPLYANFLINSRPMFAGTFVSHDMTPVAAAPEGETVVTEYTFRTSTGAKFGALTATTLNSITTSLVTVTAGSSQTYSLSNSTRHAFFVVGLGTTNQCIVLVYVSSSGGVTYTMLPDTATNIEVTTATRSVTIKTVGQQARILRMTF